MQAPESFINHSDEDREIVHRHQNTEFLFYQQVAKGDAVRPAAFP